MKNKPIANFRADFPLIVNSANTSGFIYFDNAATTQKPQAVIDVITDFYTSGNANVHRATHGLAQATTESFESARRKVQGFINASYSEEIVWTKGATDSLNILASILGKDIPKDKTNVVVTVSEHHANFVPWQQLCLQQGLEFRVIPMDSRGCLDIDKGLSLIDDGTLLVACGHVSNALGTVNPISPIIQKCKACQAYSVIDGAQAVAHLSVDVQALDCDFYVFSGHKLYAPTGIGVLYGKRKLLTELPPQQYGGEMVEHVAIAHTKFADLPFKFEAGTPNIQGVVGLGAAIDYLQSFCPKKRLAHEQQLHHKLVTDLVSIPNITLLGDPMCSIATVSFTVNGVSNQDLGILLNQHNIAVRVGHHCAMPLMQALALDGTIRISLSAYNTVGEIERFIAVLKQQITVLTQPSNTDVNPEKPTENPVEGLTEISTHYPLAVKVKSARSWDERYRQIMLASKSLALLPPEERIAEKQIHGCESQVWLDCSTVNGAVSIRAFATGKIVRGLLALMFEPLQGLSIADAVYFDVEKYLDSLGLSAHLSESRGNGLTAVMESITVTLNNKIG